MNKQSITCKSSYIIYTPQSPCSKTFQKVNNHRNNKSCFKCLSLCFLWYGWKLSFSYSCCSQNADRRKAVVLNLTERSPLMRCRTTGLFGVKRYGVHINGYTVSDSGEVSMWLARRSPTKQTYPGLLDNLVSTNQTRFHSRCIKHRSLMWMKGMTQLQSFQKWIKEADLFCPRRQPAVCLQVLASNTHWSKNVRRKRVSQQPSLRRLVLWPQ